MSPFESTLRTLRQAQGSMRQAPEKSEGQAAVLGALADGRKLIFSELRDVLGVDGQILAANLTQMHRRGLLDRWGTRGLFLYSISNKGRAHLEGSA